MEKTEFTGKNRERFIAMPGINRFSERLKIAMNGLTNVGLAAACGISESAVRSYLRGSSFPGIDKIQAIADACDAPMAWLITGEAVAKYDDLGAKFTESSLGNLIGIMGEEQKQILAKAIVQHGVAGIMSALNGMADLADFMQMTEAERAQTLRLFNQVKKGATDGSDVDTANNPATNDKRAS
ncbi:helix-turn-helix domain-containing protein [Trabulsiella odontotermitis]|uniref:helix-turn-helix domain-containing protein n=1 Tax=Trabulsiella odontotermitis TaxID=379893 RepID=UPI00067600FB|nr:helix-turn-helix transcriptional regulator [Trabulsiella odontotermitis]